MDRLENLGMAMKPAVPEDRRVAIIGGGYAGLACGVELAKAGVQVAVFERSRTLGGRARVADIEGYAVDNGQHILLGAYHELLRLLRVVGQSPKVLLSLPLTLHNPGQLHLRAGPLPAPLHLAWGLLTADGFSWRERLQAMGLMRRLQASRFELANDQELLPWLQAEQQSPRLIHLLWGPLALAALNTPLAEASAQTFAYVLRDSLAGAAEDSRLLLPRVSLSDLFPVPAARYIALRRGLVRTMEPITAIRQEENGLYRLEGDGRNQTYHHVVIATAPYHAHPLLAELSLCNALAQQIAGLQHEPIGCIWLDYGHEENGQPAVTLPAPMMACARLPIDNPSGIPIDWFFDRHQTHGQPGLFAAVISGHGEWMALPREALIEEAHRQLTRLCGGNGVPAPLWAKVVIEKRATFACHPGLQRPECRTPQQGVWLAGDYVKSPYPATLETAITSGIQTARHILSNR